MKKRIFIAATRQNDGKTVISLGLFKVLKEHFRNVGFMKPVGQKYIFVDKLKVDKDAVLIKKVFGLEDNLEYMNPVAVAEGFTRKYLESPEKGKYIQKIKNSFEKISNNKDFILIEPIPPTPMHAMLILLLAETAPSRPNVLAEIIYGIPVIARETRELFLIKLRRFIVLLLILITILLFIFKNFLKVSLIFIIILIY